MSTKRRVNSNRERVLLRDGWTCVKCGIRTDRGDIEVAHKVGVWAGGSDELDNLISLCATCHFFQPDDGDKENLEKYLSLPENPLQTAWREGFKIGREYERTGTFSL